MSFRSLVSQLWTRANMANTAGHTYNGRRNMYVALGWKRELFVEDYWSRFRRNGVANRVVRALPKATWRGGAELIEDDDPTTTTPFEDAFDALNLRLKIWPTLQRVDVLAGIGRYGIVVLGAPGRTEDPLVKCSADDIIYMKPYSELDAKVFKWDIDPLSPRFGRPLMYTVARTSVGPGGAINSNVVGKQYHYSRVLHVTDDLLDDNSFSQPRLECVWNDLDDLEKIKGGGAEAFWRRADRGIQFDLDPTIEFEEEDDDNETDAATVKKNSKAVKTIKKQIDEYEHGLRRYMLTRGVEMKEMGSDVADFANPVMSIMSLISAGTGIPQRVLMGSEQGKLAAKMDRSNWDDRVADRRDDLAGPMIVRPLIDRLVELGVLPTPKQYDVRWPQLKILDDEQRSTIAGEWASLNKNAGEVVVTADEIREYVLDLPKLSDVTAAPNKPNTTGQAPVLAPVAAARYARKWACLSTQQRRVYYKPRTVLAAPELEMTGPSALTQRLTTAIVRGRKLLAAKPELREAVQQNDREAIARLLNDTMDEVENDVVAAVPAVLTPPAPTVQPINVTVHTPEKKSVRTSKRVEYENIDGQMRPVRIIEE